MCSAWFSLSVKNDYTDVLVNAEGGKVTNLWGREDTQQILSQYTEHWTNIFTIYRILDEQYRETKCGIRIENYKIPLYVWKTRNSKIKFYSSLMSNQCQPTCWQMTWNLFRRIETDGLCVARKDCGIWHVSPNLWGLKCLDCLKFNVKITLKIQFQIQTGLMYWERIWLANDWAGVI